MATKKLSNTAKLFIGIIVILVILFIFGGGARTAQFFAPSNVTCSDSDGGINSGTLGTCKDLRGNYTDRCLFNNTLAEFSCGTNSTCVITNITCPFGQVCSNGRCVSGGSGGGGGGKGGVLI